jgi:hypothetical protein
VEYMLLIYVERDPAGAPAEEREAMFVEFGKYTRRLGDSGALVAADPLEPARTAATVRLRDGELVTTDGPFAETKEWLAGYYKIDVDSHEEALEWASQIPSVRAGGAIEVRPVQPVPASEGLDRPEAASRTAAS